jgi:hypothetical protein
MKWIQTYIQVLVYGEIGVNGLISLFTFARGIILYIIPGISPAKQVCGRKNLILTFTIRSDNSNRPHAIMTNDTP